MNIGGTQTVLSASGAVTFSNTITVPANNVYWPNVYIYCSEIGTASASALIRNLVITTSTISVAPTVSPTAQPSTAPSAVPTAGPTSNPTVSPTPAPSATPSQRPSVVPSVTPTPAPSAMPTSPLLPIVLVPTITTLVKNTLLGMISLPTDYYLTFQLIVVGILPASSGFGSLVHLSATNIDYGLQGMPSQAPQRAQEKRNVF